MPIHSARKALANELVLSRTLVAGLLPIRICRLRYALGTVPKANNPMISRHATRMDELRGWLTARDCQHTLTSTGSSRESVVLVEFASDTDANDFAREFGGTLVPD